MKISLPEIIDRLTILKLKIERVKEPHTRIEFNEYKKALQNFKNQGIKIKLKWFDELYEINRKIWDLEWDVRKIVNSKKVWQNAEKFGFEELGKRIIKVEELMKQRVKIKNNISLKTKSGFKEMKINHCAE